MLILMISTALKNVGLLILLSVLNLHPALSAETADRLGRRLSRAYLKATGLKANNSKVDYFFVKKTEPNSGFDSHSGTLYDVTLVDGANQPVGPILRYFVFDVDDSGDHDTVQAQVGEIHLAREPYVKKEPDFAYVVFATIPPEQFGSTFNELPGLNGIFAAPAPTDAKIREQLQWRFDPQSQLRKPLYVSFRKQKSNDGTNFPWWSWSAQNPEYSFTAIENSTSPKEFSQAVAVALLDKEGRVVMGQLQLGGLVGADVSQVTPLTQWPEPKNAFQEYVMAPFRQSLSVALRQQKFIEDFGPSVIQYVQSESIAPITGAVLVDKKLEMLKFKLENTHLGTIGIAPVENAQQGYTHYRHSLIFRSSEGPLYNFHLFFQNNLNDLVGRTLHFRGNPYREVGNYQEPVNLWFGKTLFLRAASLPNYTGSDDEVVQVPFSSQGRPVDEGWLTIKSLTVHPRLGTLTSLKATLEFTERETPGRPVTRGVISFQLTPKTVRLINESHPVDESPGSCAFLLSSAKALANTK